MSFITWVVTFLEKLFSKTINVIILAGYNQRTIYKYFRRQGAKIGEGCCISVKSIGTEPYLVSIGDNVWISYDVIFHTHDGAVLPLKKKHEHLHVYGTITIEDNCLIGRSVQLLPNIHIGRNSVVGAGSVVISDVPPDSIVMGVPARPVGSISKYEERCLAAWKVQKPPELDEITKKWRTKKSKQILRRHLTEVLVNRDRQEHEKNP